MTTAPPTSASPGDVLKVGEVIKPHVSESYVREVIKKLYGLDVTNMKELNSYDDRNYLVHVKEEHTNSFLDKPDANGYIFKILNSMDSRNTSYVEAMQSLVIYAHEQGIQTTYPVKSASGQLMHLEEIPTPEPETGGGKARSHIVRLFTYIPGEILVKAPYTAGLCYRVGKFAGRLDRKLKTFHNSFYDSHGNIWSLQNLLKLHDFTYAVQDAKDRELVKEVLGAFQKDVIPHYGEFQKGMIHGDLNEQNILVRKKEPNGNDVEDGEYEVCGIIDFGDATQSFLLFEIAIAICYIMVDSKVIDAIDAGGHALAGYVSEIALTERELGALRVCVAGRLCQSLVMGAYTYSLDPSNDYVMTTAARGWPCLRSLWTTPPEQLRARWHAIISTYNN